jgi:hypothetical protein
MNNGSNSSSETIFRFTDSANLMDIFQRKALTFVTLDQLEDPYERYVFEALRTSAGKEQVSSILPSNSAEGWMAILQAVEMCWYIQSWTRCQESDALWRIYSHGNRSVRIEVSLEDIKKLQNVTAFNVEYSETLSLKQEIESISTPDKILMDSPRILIHKRTAFSHEFEVRLLSFELNNMDNTPGLSNEQRNTALKAILKLYQDGKVTEDMYKNALYIYSEKHREKIKHISFGHIDNFIKSVMVHPLAPNWFCETIGIFCKNNNVPFLGKSNLYTFRV